MRWLRPVLVLVALLVAGALIWLRATTFDGVGGPAMLSVSEVYRGVERELRRHDGIYVATVDVKVDAAALSYQGTITRWVDVRRDVSREEWNMTPMGSSVMITTGGGRYSRDASGRITPSPARYWTCHGAGIAASAVLGCPGPTERSMAEVRDGTHEGRPSVVLFTSGTVSGSDETYTFKRQLHLDTGTYLPLALDGEGQMDMGTVVAARERYRFQHRFVQFDSAAKDLFDPASIGYVASDPAATLDRALPDVQVYWLGTEFAGASGLPTVVLSKVDAPEHGPGYRYLLHYAPREDPYAPSVVTLQLWPRSAWDAIVRGAPLGHVWDDPCWSRDEVSLPNATALIFSGFAGEVRMGAPSGSSCPSRLYDTFLAHVYLVDAVVLVAAPGASGISGIMKSPYDTRAGIEALVRGVRRR